MPLANGVVIGIGGTGAQVLSRLRTFIESERPDAGVRSELEFLQIDALDLDQQPKVIAQSGLRPEEYFNLIPSAGFDPRHILSAERGVDPYLDRQWGDNYVPESGQVVQALKASRRLGRLAFYNRKAELTTRIGQAMRDAQRIHQENVAHGMSAGEGGSRELPVFIVASAIGGTGSSGFLEVVHSVYAAGRLVGNPTIKIYAVIFLPGVYRGVTQAGPMSSTQVRQHHANAYAFFRELDHFMHRSGEFFADFDRNKAGVRIDDPESNHRLLHQAFLMDTSIGGVGSVGHMDDVFAVTAESLYQLIMTERGRPLLGQAATNYDIAFQARDIRNKSLSYCSLGISSVVFPGDTYRAYLRNRYKDHLIRSLIVPSTSDTSLAKSTVSAGATDDAADGNTRHEMASAADQGVLADAIFTSLNTNLLGQVASGTVLRDEAEELRRLATSAESMLRSRPEMEMVTNIVNRAQLLSGNGTLLGDLRRAYAATVDSLSEQIDQSILVPLLASGEPLPYLERTLLRVKRQMSDANTTAAAVRAASIDQASTVFDGSGIAGKNLQQAMDAFRQADQPPVWQRLVGRGDEEKAAAAGRLGQLLSLYCQGILDDASLGATIELGERILKRLDLLAKWSDQAEAALDEEKRSLRARWQRDDLLGKDVGPRDTQVLLPEDVRPEVDTSALALRVWDEALADFRSEYAQEGTHMTSAIYAAVSQEVPGGGILALGASDPELSSRARRALTAVLDEWAERKAVHDEDANPRLPADLAAAAGSEDRLRSALDGMRRVARGVYWNFDPTKALYQSGDKVQEPVVTYVATGAAKTYLSRTVPNPAETVLEGVDPERATAIIAQYAVPVHALVEIPVWQRDHDHVVESLRTGGDMVKPPYVDSRYTTTLEPLVPEYFDRDKVSQRVARGLVLELLWGRPEMAARTSPEARRSGVLPLDTSQWPAEGPISGWPIRFDDVAKHLIATGERVNLGATPAQLVQGMGARELVARGVDAAWTEAIAAFTPTDLLDASRRTLMQLLPVFVKESTRQRDLESLSALDGIGRALEALCSTFEAKVIRSGGNLPASGAPQP
jgi:hypothetical protein